MQAVFGPETNLEPDNLRCLLLVVTKNVTTDSPWPISSNPEAKYNGLTRKDCNLRIPLWQLVRASTAAPVYFPPEILQWDKSDPSKTFVFVDGGVTPHNNPAFLLYRMATEPAERFGSLQDARSFSLEFFAWYNDEHRHSGLGLLSSAVVHYGLAPEAIERRRAVLDAAYSAHPERFVRKPPQPLPAPKEVWINKQQPTPENKTQ